MRRTHGVIPQGVPRLSDAITTCLANDISREPPRRQDEANTHGNSRKRTERGPGRRFPERAQLVLQILRHSETKRAPAVVWRPRNAYFEKSTFGACAASGVWSSKYSRGPFPIAFAVSTCGNRRMYALYRFTASL